MIHVIVFFLLISSAFSFADADCKRNDFDSFLKQFVSFEQQSAFKDYYETFIVRERDRVDHAKRTQIMRDLATNGKAALEVEAPTYFAQLKKNNWADNEQRKLYVRYGAYQEFLKSEIKAKNSFFVKARGYVTGAKSKIVGWLGSWRKAKTIA